MNSTTRQPPGWERCPYLGLHDDSSTALAYASPWNYCFRATPPASLQTSYQSEACLCREYIHCTIYTSNKWGRLPRSLRGRLRLSTPKNQFMQTLVRLIILLLLIAILILTIYLPLSALPW